MGDNMKQPLSSSSLHSLSVKTSNSLTLWCLFNACRPKRLMSSLDRYRHVNAMYSVHWGRWSRNLLIIWQHLPQGENELYSCTLTALLKEKITPRSYEQICVMATIWFYMQDCIQEVSAIFASQLWARFSQTLRSSYVSRVSAATMSADEDWHRPPL